MGALKKAGKGLLIALIAIVGLVVLAGGFFWVKLQFTLEQPASFLPDKFAVYAQIPSLRSLYEDLINLEAADRALSAGELASFRAVLTNIRALSLSDSPLFNGLVDLRADVMMLKDGKAVVAADLGWRGALTDLAKLAGPWLSFQGYSFATEDGLPIFAYDAGGVVIYASFFSNVALITTDKATLKACAALKGGRKNLATRIDDETLALLARPNEGTIRVLADTAGFLAGPLAASGLRFKEQLDFSGESVLDFKISDSEVMLTASVPAKAAPGAEAMKAMLARGGSVPGALSLVPAKASLMSYVNLAPLGDLLAVTEALEGGSIKDTVAKADEAMKGVFGADSKQLLFSWLGSEAGAFMMPRSAEPTFFARISDRGAYERAFGLLSSTVLMSEDSSVVIDGVRLSRMTFPWYVSLLLDGLGVKVPSPFYFDKGDYLFLSMDAENLAAVAKAATTGAGIARDESFMALSRGMGADGALGVYYDLKKSVPFFLRGSGTVEQILKLYGKGYAALYARGQRLELRVHAMRSEAGGAGLLAGFPLAAAGALSGDLAAFRLPGQSGATLGFVLDSTRLHLSDPVQSKDQEAQVEAGSRILVGTDPAGGASAIWAVSPSGTVYRFDGELRPAPGFPVATGVSSPMPALLESGRAVLYSRVDSALSFVDGAGDQSLLKLPGDGELFAPPDFEGGLVAYYPKSFEGLIHLVDAATGREREGWPVQAEGISFCSPRFVDAGGGERGVAFLTQGGTLYLWGLDGKPRPGFPFALPGVHYATPVPLRANGIPAVAGLSADGVLSLVSAKGTLLREQRLPRPVGKDARLLARDVDGDGSDELFVYGSGAFIDAYDATLRSLPGFPVKGYTEPRFIDFNRDRKLDMVTAGLDNAIYAYSLR